NTQKNTEMQSEKTAEMTRQLMRALMNQTMLPLATAYSPPLISLTAPFFGIYFPYIADISPLLCGVHSVTDACLIIYTIKEYRNILLRWLARNRTKIT
ncbi:hypothetical protein PMAYCL1PPCAC_17209, partial [Pristionchus mayeri]